MSFSFDTVSIGSYLFDEHLMSLHHALEMPLLFDQTCGSRLLFGAHGARLLGAHVGHVLAGQLDGAGQLVGAQR